MHIKAQQQAAENACDKGHGNPLCLNAGYYSGVAEANFENTHNNNGTS